MSGAFVIIVSPMSITAPYEITLLKKIFEYLVKLYQDPPKSRQYILFFNFKNIHPTDPNKEFRTGNA